jgi:PilZ domain-containing protein
LTANKNVIARKLAEQRISPRVSVGAPASLRWGEEQLTGFVESINLAGMYVASARAPGQGEYVDFVFSLPRGGRAFRVRATVVHTLPHGRRPGFGARFERAPLGFLEAIRGLAAPH